MNINYIKIFAGATVIILYAAPVPLLKCVEKNERDGDIISKFLQMSICFHTSYITDIEAVSVHI